MMKDPETPSVNCSVPPPAPLPSQGWVPAWEGILHLAELLQFPVEIKEALGRGSGHAAVNLVQLLLDMLCHLHGSKARGDSVRFGQ